MLSRTNRITLIFFLITFNVFCQIDSLKTKKYWEDQLFFSLTYNILTNQPDSIDPSEVSYGFSVGYIKDIPFNKKGTTALGLGIAYNYDLFAQSLVVDSSTFSVNSNANSNKLKMYNIEFPIQFRLRTSDVTTYSFWRVYFGVRFRYNFFNKVQYTLDEADYVYTNLDSYNKIQSGIELSAGYGAFNFHVYYGLSPIFNDAYLDGESIDTSMLKLGLIFYLL